ncbi:FHA domain-containing protein [bacterium]|nr:FHA domain-containing protein [bacterium]
MYNLIVTDGKSFRQEFPLQEQITIIGREESCHISISSQTISRKHFRIIAKGLKMYIEDLGSSNGTLLNEQKIDKVTEITENDIIQFGIYYAQLNNTNKLKKSYKVDDIATSKQMDIVKKNQAPYFKLICDDKRYPGLIFEISEGLNTIGRTKASTIVIPDNSLSKKHLELNKLGPKLEIQDLGSINGTKVNSRKLRSKQRVYNGDKLEIGDVKFSIDSNIETTQKGGKNKKLLIIVGVVLLLGGGAAFILKPKKADNKKTETVTIDDKIEQREKEIQKKMGLSELSATKGNWDDAITHAKAVLESDPANEKMKLLLAKYKDEQINYEYFKQGRQALDLFDYEKACDLLKKIPKNTYYYSNATMLFRQSQEELIKKYFRDAKTFNKAKRYNDAYEQLRKLFELTVHHDDARKLKESIEGSMKYYGIKYEKFEIKTTELETDVTEEQIDLDALKKRYPEHELNTAMKYFIGGDISRAIKFLGKVGASHKNYQAAQQLLRQLQLYKSKFDSGNSDFINKNYPQARISWQTVLDIDKELLSETKIISKYAKQIKYHLSVGFNELGRDALKSEHYKAAFKYFKESEDFNPQNTQNLEDLAKIKKLARDFWEKSLILEKKGDKKAFTYWENILAITTDDDPLNKQARKKITQSGR